jgi:aspartate aminotransferase
MSNIQSQSTSNACSIAQKAATAALLDGNRFTDGMVREFSRRRRTMVERLNKIPGITCRMPTGAFYAFPNVAGVLGRRHGDDTVASPSDLASYLLREAKVAVVPGEPFGSRTHLRLSYATSLEAIIQGLDRIEAALRNLR